jgi:hypothetical protein
LLCEQKVSRRSLGEGGHFFVDAQPPWLYAGVRYEFQTRNPRGLI